MRNCKSRVIKLIYFNLQVLLPLLLASICGDCVDDQFPLLCDCNVHSSIANQIRSLQRQSEGFGGEF